MRSRRGCLGPCRLSSLSPFLRHRPIFDSSTWCSLVAGRWSLVAGRWSLVAGRWSLVAGRWSLVHPPLPSPGFYHIIPRDGRADYEAQARPTCSLSARPGSSREADRPSMVALHLLFANRHGCRFPC
ncbi:hypothetical protein GQ53DRAFT_471343 [Thozetella sp. PMI_491]|nr:hypothetical protein GQ53DRAFT_471343 [Thozetella sp. PMI_491]